MEAIQERKMKDQSDISFDLMDNLEIAKFPPQIDPLDYMSSVPDQEKEKIEVIANELKEQNFDIIKYAGKGQFGVVVIVKKNIEGHQNSEVRYAVKCIGITNQFGNKDNKIIQQAQVEIENHKKCNSEFVVTYLNSCQTKYFYYIFMEECVGTLENLFELYHKNFNENTFIKFGLDILQGLKDCHIQQVIIRDIKPDNILINYQNKAKLSDFGFARQLNQGQSALNSVIQGNALFQSPESLQSTTTEVNEQIQKVFEQKKNLNQTKQTQIPKNKQGIRSDIYSIGQLLFFLLGGSFLEIVRKVMGDLEGDYISQQKNLFNRNKIKLILKGLNEYLPYDRISIDEAIQKFLDLDFIDPKSNKPVSLLNFLYPSSINSTQLKNQQKYTQIENSNFIPLNLLQNQINNGQSIIFQNNQQNKQQVKQQNGQLQKQQSSEQQNIQQNEQQNYTLSQQIQNLVYSLIKEYNPDKIPLSKMLFCYNWYACNGFQIYYQYETDTLKENEIRSLIVSKHKINIYHTKNEHSHSFDKKQFKQTIDTIISDGYFTRGENYINHKCKQYFLNLEIENEFLYLQLMQVIIPIIQAQVNRDNTQADFSKFVYYKLGQLY